jgi:ligand-binding sensor domain-containing protein
MMASLPLLPALFASAAALGNVDDVRACTPLPNGSIAAATGAGLVVVGKDPTTVTRLTAKDGLPDTRAHAVAFHGNDVWVGTEGGAAIVRDLKVVRTLLDAPVTSVVLASGGPAHGGVEATHVWLGTRGDGVYRATLDGATKVRIPSRATGTRVSALVEHRGTLFAAYADGPVAKLEAGALVALPTAPRRASALAVLDDAVFVGDLTGLHRLDAKGFASVSSVDARGLAAHGGALLVGTYGAGLLTGSARGVLRAERGIPGEVRGVGVLGDRRCAATTEGLFVADGARPFERVALGPSLPSNDITAVAMHASGKRMAIGTFESGAAIVDERGTISRIDGVDARESVNATLYQGDTLWLSTVHGLYRVARDGSVRRFTVADGLPSTSTRALAALDAQSVLVGTDGGPAVVTGDRVARAVDHKARRPGSGRLGAPVHATWAVAKRHDGALLVGTVAGLYIGKGGRFERLSVATGHLLDDWVTALAVDGRDVYVGTYSKGVTRLRFDGGADGPPEVAHLGGGYVNPDGLVVRRGVLYAATMNHLLSRPADAEPSAAWVAHPEASLGRDVTAVRFAGSAMVVASRRGVAVTRGTEKP